MKLENEETIMQELSGIRSHLQMANESMMRLETFVRGVLLDESGLTVTTPIADLDWSQRAKTCIAKMKIKTIGELISTPYERLAKVRAMGDGTLKEIERELAKAGLKIAGR